MAEPAAVVLAQLAFAPTGPDEATLAALLAVVAGVMAALSATELLPSAAAHISRGRCAVAAALGAMGMTAAMAAADALQQQAQAQAPAPEPA
jgi:hypothetical protein